MNSRPRTRRLASIAAAIAAALSVLITGSADADTQNRRDPARDVVKIVDDQIVMAHRDAKRDIVGMRTTYANRRLVVTLTLRNLTRDYLNVDLKTFTPAGHGKLSWNPEEGVTISDFARVACPGPTVERRFARDRIVITIPRRCLARATYVRTGAIVSTFTDSGVYIADDARRAHSVSLNQQPRLGAPVPYN